MSRFPSTIFAGRRYAVVGLGRAGIATLRALAAMGAIVTGWDDAGFARDAAQREGFAVVDPTADIGDLDALVLSPGIPHMLPVPHRLAASARLAGVPILTDAELLFQAVRRAGGKARFWRIFWHWPACRTRPAPISGRPRSVWNCCPTPACMCSK
jgi:UDP-N-acetylmuramoylalanine--D-glutamate ligase